MKTQQVLTLIVLLAIIGVVIYIGKNKPEPVPEATVYSVE
jgi:hypothetical protein